MRGAKVVLVTDWQVPTHWQSGLANHRWCSPVQGGTIPSLFIRNWRVERFIPRRVAAPFGPETTHRVSFKVAMICARCACSRVSYCPPF